MGVAVEFLRDNPPYRTGERATFSPERAGALVASGAARLPADTATSDLSAGDMLGGEPSAVHARKKTTAMRRYVGKDG